VDLLIPVKEVQMGTVLYYSDLHEPPRPVVLKLFRCADHLEKFGGPRSTKYWFALWVADHQWSSEQTLGITALGPLHVPPVKNLCSIYPYLKAHTRNKHITHTHTKTTDIRHIPSFFLSLILSPLSLYKLNWKVCCNCFWREGEWVRNVFS